MPLGTSSTARARGGAREHSANECGAKRYLVNRVLRSPVPLSTADLAEELFVSTSTMNAVLSRARRHLAPFDLTLVQADGHLSVHGTEKNKRRVLGELLYDEASASFLDVATIQHAFPDIDAPASARPSSIRSTSIASS